MTDLKQITETSTDRGQNDVKPTGMAVNAAKTVKETVTNKLDPLVEIYAQMFAHGVRTPVLRRPDEYGMDYDRRAMSWSDTGRLVGRIIERAEFGITQGSAIRSDGGG